MAVITVEVRDNLGESDEQKLLNAIAMLRGVSYVGWRAKERYKENRKLVEKAKDVILEEVIATIDNMQDVILEQVKETITNLDYSSLTKETDGIAE